MTPHDKAVLKKTFRTMREAAKARDQRACLVADACLGKTLNAAAGNARAQQFVSSVNVQWDWIWLGIIALGDFMDQPLERVAPS
ncbi:MAG TPA: FCD domain-containing protein [Candidatus Acidoferrum sp.]|nr:FCD domain-containing protein [Candidatus Acidoferrum sp.]